jgi:electron transfer flavoprotein alpha subunit
MPTILAVGEVVDGAVTRLSTEVATLARTLADASGWSVEGIVFGDRADDAGRDLARYLPVVRFERGIAADRTIAPVAAALSVEPADLMLLPASPDGRDIAGALSALTGLGVLTNATAVRWGDEGPVVEMSVFGGRLVTESAFTPSERGLGRGIVTVRPNAVAAEPLAEPGRVEDRAGSAGPDLPVVRVVDRVDEASGQVSIDDASVIVAGGRGVAGPEGFALVQDLAQRLGGAVGATRAAVDAGWVDYGQQIGQTGKIVKPRLYVALGISGAIQHKVGMQTAETIVAINRDPDAPLAEFADLYVVGDLFEVVPALLDELRSRAG